MAGEREPRAARDADAGTQGEGARVLPGGRRGAPLAPRPRTPRTGLLGPQESASNPRRELPLGSQPALSSAPSDRREGVRLRAAARERDKAQVNLATPDLEGQADEHVAKRSAPTGASPKGSPLHSKVSVGTARACSGRANSASTPCALHSQRAPSTGRHRIVRSPLAGPGCLDFTSSRLTKPSPIHVGVNQFGSGGAVPIAQGRVALRRGLNHGDKPGPGWFRAAPGNAPKGKPRRPTRLDDESCQVVLGWRSRLLELARANTSGGRDRGCLLCDTPNGLRIRTHLRRLTSDQG